MKKLLLSLALILSVSALSAQRISVTEEATGNVVESGASYFIYGDGSASYGYPGGPLQVKFIVKSTATDSIVIKGEKIENNVVEGSNNDFCLFQCYAPTVYVSPDVPLGPADEKEFSVHYQPDFEVSYTELLDQQQSMTYYIYESNNPDEKFIVNVTFMYTLDGVEDLSKVEMFSNAYPMPASDVVNFDYNFTSNVNAEVAIYNMMGQEVLRNSVSGMSGKTSINVSDLSDGVYFYSLIVNGAVEKSNKLVIKK